MARTAIGTSRNVAGTRTVIDRHVVRNGDFELAPPFTAATSTSGRFIDGTAAGSTTNDAWVWQTYLEFAASIQFDNTTSKSGTNSLKIVSAASPPSANHQISAYLGGNTNTVKVANKYFLPITPLAKYIVSGWIKTSSITNVNSRGAKINLTTWSADMTSSGAAGATINLNGTNDWTFASVTFTAGSGKTWLNIDCEIRGEQGTAWFDDIRVTPVARSTA